MSVILPDQVYDCVGCGKSCTAFEVEIQPAELEALRARPLTQELEGAGRRPLRVLESGRLFLGKEEGGRCSYLVTSSPERRETPATRCSLQERHGYLSKPQTCRDFPFQAVPTPDGVFIGLSFACTAVAQNQGRPLEAHRQELTERFGPLATDLPERWPLWGEVAVDWANYRGIEDYLVSHLERRSDVGLLIGAARLARAVRDGDSARLHDEGNLGSGLGPAADQLLSGLLTLIETAGEPEAEVESVLRAFYQAGSYTSRILGTEIRLSELPAALPEGFGAQSDRYLRHLLFRKTLLAPPDVLSRACLLPLVAHALRFFAQAAAQKQQRSIELRDFEEAVGILEGRLMMHARGMDSYFSRIGRIFIEQA